jgi:hypothetical protein
MDFYAVAHLEEQGHKLRVLRVERDLRDAAHLDAIQTHECARAQATDWAGDVRFKVLVLRFELHARQPQGSDEDASQHSQHECSDRNVIGPCLHQHTF